MRYALTTKGVLRLTNRQSPGAMVTLLERNRDAPIPIGGNDLIVLFAVARYQNNQDNFDDIAFDSSPMTEDEVRRSMRSLFEHGFIDQVNDNDENF